MKESEKKTTAAEAADLKIPKQGDHVFYRKGNKVQPLLVVDIDKATGVLSGLSFDMNVSGFMEPRKEVKPGLEQGEWWSDDEVLRAKIALEINRTSRSTS